MKRPAQHHFRVSLAQSVRTRLTLWYLAVMAFIVFIFGGSLYATQTFLNADAAESRLETQLYQDSQRFAQTYEQALLDHQAPTGSPSQPVLAGDGAAAASRWSVLDLRGPLTSNVIQHLQARAEQNAEMIDLTVPQSHSIAGDWWGHGERLSYPVTPVLNQNARVATLLVGCRASISSPSSQSGSFGALLALLVAAIGGYWLAGKALRPVKMITRMANEINATDLRRRLAFASAEMSLANWQQPLIRCWPAWKPPSSGKANSRQMPAMNYARRSPLSTWRSTGH